MITPDKKKSLISIQKKWLKACESKCAKKGAAYGGHHPWPLAIETMCLAQNKRERSEQFKSLYECIGSDEGHCQQLTNRP